MNVEASDAAVEVPRMFASVTWCGEEAGALVELQGILRGAPGAGAWRWIQADDLHLTLRFHGDASARQSAAVAATLARLAQEGPFAPLRFERFDTWPGVLVARFAATTALQSLQARLEGDALEQGFAAETRPWSPHVTLARTPRDHAVELPKIKLAPFELPVARFALCRRAESGPSRYARIATFELPAGK